MIDEQTLLVNTLGNGKRTAQRICILMLGCKWLLDELWSLLNFGPYFWIGQWMSIVVAQLKEKTSPIKTLLKTITKFLNVIGYYQPNLDTYRIYVHIMLVIGQCQHIMPKYVDSNSHVHMQLYLFYENVYIRCLVSLLNFVILWVNRSQNFVIQFSINILSHD